MMPVQNANSIMPVNGHKGCQAKHADNPGKSRDASEGFQRAIGKPVGGALGQSPKSRFPWKSCFVDGSE